MFSARENYCIRRLMNVIRSEAVDHELDKPHKEKACGCIEGLRFKADTNASYRCSAEDRRTIMHRLEAIESVNEHGILC